MRVLKDFNSLLEVGSLSPLHEQTLCFHSNFKMTETKPFRLTLSSNHLFPPFKCFLLAPYIVQSDEFYNDIFIQVYRVVCL